MKKATIFTLIAAFVILAGAVWIYARGGRTPAEPEVIDYSSLEKDTLYGEEEGKYANLPELGKQLLREAASFTGCAEAPDEVSCRQESEWAVTNSSIISFKNGLFLLNVPNGKGGSYDKIYSPVSRSFAADPVGHFGTRIRNSGFLVYVYRDATDVQKLLYYRAGMNVARPT
jgi:hypothetical protein